MAGEGTEEVPGLGDSSSIGTSRFGVPNGFALPTGSGADANGLLPVVVGGALPALVSPPSGEGELVAKDDAGPGLGSWVSGGGREAWVVVVGSTPPLGDHARSLKNGLLETAVVSGTATLGESELGSGLGEGATGAGNGDGGAMPPDSPGAARPSVVVCVTFSSAKGLLLRCTGSGGTPVPPLAAVGAAVAQTVGPGPGAGTSGVQSSRDRRSVTISGGAGCAGCGGGAG